MSPYGFGMPTVSGATFDLPASCNCQAVVWIAGIAAFTRPATSEVLDAGLVNWGTFAGAVCFAIGGAVQLFDKPTTTRTVVQHTP